jgi:hypothetical protein
MLPPSMAFAWILWRQHRWGLLVVMSSLFLAGGLSALVSAHSSRSVAENLFGSGMWPLMSLLLYPLCVFTYAFDAGDLLARESCFPARLLRLPVPTRTLVAWPMACGAAAVFLLWLGTALFIFQPWLRLLQAEMPLWWPSMMAVAILAWTQALLWAPFGLPGFRVFLVFVLILSMIGSSIAGVKFGVSEGSLAALYAGLAAIAWTMSYAGVRHARRGDVPNWDGILWPLRQIARWRPQRRQSFASDARAQVWFEWRLTGKTLPIMTGLMLPLSLLLLFLDKIEVGMTAQSLLCTLAVPVLLAGTAGWLGSRHNRWVKERSGMMPFIATLPMTSADMVGAILKAAARTTLAAFALVAVAWPLAAMLTGNLPEVADWWRLGLREHSLSQIVAGTVAIAILLLVWTWKRKLDCLYVGLIGSKWIEASVALGSIPGAYFLCIFVATIYVQPAAHYETTLTLWPWFVGALLLCRLGTTAWALRQVLCHGLMRPRTAACWVAGWVLLASLLFGLLAWAIPAELVPVYLLACGVAFVMPMARLAASPLALAWNRHR